MTDTPNQAEVEKLLPCSGMPLCLSQLYEGHSPDCPARHRPLLQQRDEKIATKDARIGALEAEIVRLRTAQSVFKPFAQLAFLWGKEPAREGEVDKYRAAYHAWLDVLSHPDDSALKEGGTDV